MVDAPIIIGSGRTVSQSRTTVTFKRPNGSVYSELTTTAGEAFTQKVITRKQPRPYINPLPYEVARARYSVSDNVKAINLLLQGNLKKEGTYHPMMDGPFQAWSNGVLEYNQYSLYSNWSLATERAAIDLQTKAAGIEYELANEALQLHSTVMMMAGRTLQVLRTLRSLSRGDTHGAYRHLFGGNPKSRLRDSPASLWLEWQYGWSPLIGDIYKGYVDLSEGISKPIIKLRGRGEADLDQRIYGPLAYSSRFVPDGAFSFDGKCTARAYCNLTIDPLQQSWVRRLGLTNPLLIGWQAIPHSFVIDWFYPLSDLFESWTGAWLLRGNLMSIGARAKAKASCSGVSTGRVSSVPASWIQKHEGSAVFTQELSYFKRTVRDGGRLGNISFQWPFDSDKRLLNAVALISTRR